MDAMLAEVPEGTDGIPAEDAVETGPEVNSASGEGLFDETEACINSASA
jgi:hypothetical protein